MAENLRRLELDMRCSKLHANLNLRLLAIQSLIEQSACSEKHVFDAYWDCKGSESAAKVDQDSTSFKLRGSFEVSLMFK